MTCVNLVIVIRAFMAAVSVAYMALWVYKLGQASSGDADAIFWSVFGSAIAIAAAVLFAAVVSSV